MSLRRVTFAVGLALLASGLFHLLVFAIDGGPWEGPVSWRKPTTFGLSFGLTLLTVAWLSGYLRAPRWLLAVFAADCVVEVAGITVQAWRGVPSHFNMETPVNRAIAMMLAAGGFILVVVLLAMTWYAFRGDPAQSPSMRLALRTGFATMVIALASGAVMIARGVTLVNTGHQQSAYQLGGFLKPLHGVSLHGVLVLPAIAWLAARMPWSETTRVRVVATAAAGYGLAMVVALAISLAR
ncbi:MAG: hypothetical protein HOU81_22810 [Hamadaea sp.]|uniref:hypothetical protein n=1 Tax=Hamadaea sp. TaxID=2024425 RepID=UPI0018063287|nr:hypothetical protein [Hamadaea sp.]NUR73659.1 hypothetical protein [Hamadaea sp.]NUT17976.1 hypothetical protein [Hamadaea sp.]